MKIASYNIMSGGFSGYNHEQMTPPRLPEIQAAVRELDADVIGLIDTFRWDEIFSNEQLCDLFGYKYVACINLNDERLKKSGHNNGLTLMGNHPWLNCETIELGTRDVLKATFELNGREITIVLAYLDDLQEDTRLRQVRAIVDSVGGVEDVLIMGDLNTLALKDVDTVDHALERFYVDNPGIEEKFESVFEQMQRGEVVAWLESQGFIDTGVDIGSTMPSRLFPVTADKPFLRLDYCFRGSGLRVGNFAVHATEVMQKSSDHFPISFIVE